MDRLHNIVFFLLLTVIMLSIPNADAQWIKSTDGLYGGQVNDLDLNSLGHIFAASYGGIFQSTNSGVSWTLLNDEITNVDAIAISGSKIFAGTFLKGIYLSTTNGQSWIQIDNGPIFGKQTNDIAIDGSNVYVATRYAVFLTNDDGVNWTDISDSLAGKWFNTIAVHDSKVYVGTNDGLFVSPDSGANWIPLKNGLTSNSGNCYAFSGSNIFAGTYGNGVFFPATVVQVGQEVPPDYQVRMFLRLQLTAPIYLPALQMVFLYQWIMVIPGARGVMGLQVNMCEISLSGVQKSLPARKAGAFLYQKTMA